MGKLTRLLDYFFITRPVLFYPIWSVFLAGYIAAGRQMGDVWHSSQKGLSQPLFWIALTALSFLMAAVFIINQITDIKTDKDNNKLFLIANGIVSKKMAVRETILLSISAFAMAFIIKVELFILLVLLFLFTGVAYSLSPFLYKDRPFAGLLVNFVGGMFTFLYGWNVFGHIFAAGLIRSLPYIFAIGAVYCLTTIPDQKGDKNAGKITLAVKYGTKVTIVIGIFFEICCILFSLWFKDLIILIPAVISFYFFSRLLWSQDMTHILQATRFPILFLSISVGVIFPVYFLMMIAIYLLSKGYYKKRFNLDYPSLTKVQESS